jgi:tRNA(Ile2)-agmatinylcytidine synthase
VGVTVVGLDDTDSRAGMCTTYLAARLARRLRERGATVERRLLVRLNPAVEHKTRGNGALAVHTDASPETAFALAREAVEREADPAEDTNPGLVVAPGDPGAVADDVAAFARSAVRDLQDLDDALALADAAGYRTEGWGIGRGRIGALAAVGAWAAVEEWTVERIAYRERERWGTERDVDADSVFAAADRHYPVVWDTVDRGADEVVCVPHTPGPVLYGVRGDDAGAVEAAAAAIDGESAAFAATFHTNQGTDAHLRSGTVGDLTDRRAYRVTGTVLDDPATREGGHVFFALADGDATVDCVAFEPTKRFREVVRALRAGDRVTACGEVAAGTLKLEKLALREAVTTESVTPECPDCGRRMESAGADQGYRCRDCGTDASGPAEHSLDRDLSTGWYEVPPRARRHIAKPLVRGGFDAPVHPER